MLKKSCLDLVKSKLKYFCREFVFFLRIYFSAKAKGMKKKFLSRSRLEFSCLVSRFSVSFHHYWETTSGLQLCRGFEARSQALSCKNLLSLSIIACTLGVLDIKVYTWRFQISRNTVQTSGKISQFSRKLSQIWRKLSQISRKFSQIFTQI